MDQPFNAINDPLGQLINLQAKARQRRFSEAVANPMSQTGPLPDPQWDAYFEAVDEANPGKTTKFTGGGGLPNAYSPPMQGLQSASAPSASTSPDDRALFFPNTGADAKLLAARKKGLK